MTLIPADLSNLTPYREHAHKCLSGDGKEFYRICKKLGLNPIIGIDRTVGTYKIIVSFRHYACSLYLILLFYLIESDKKRKG